jgi:Cof subfamily protein (haloacid dehalogenase superfamily)
MTPVRPTRAVTIAAVISDVDGSLVTDDKVLTAPTRAAVAALAAHGIIFTIVSSRPPRGLRMLLDALKIAMPFGSFNGAVIARPDLSEIETHLLSREVARRAVEMLDAYQIPAWVFAGPDWLLRDAQGPLVALEQRTLGFAPTVVEDFGGRLDAAAKIVGASVDFDRLATCERDMRAALGGTASVVRSQPYYLDITDPHADKGAALLELSRLIKVRPANIAAIGDGHNDIAMFRRSGLAIAMGNADPDVQRAADVVTDSNREDGFAKAVDRFILHAMPLPCAEAP